MEKIFLRSFLIALSEGHRRKIEDTSLYYLSCAIIADGRLVGLGTNSAIYHAEVNAALLAAARGIDIRKSKVVDVIVLRITRVGKLSAARPCRECLRMLKFLGVTNIYYSTSNGDIVCERGTEMVSNYISYGHRLRGAIEKKNEIYDLCLQNI